MLFGSGCPLGEIGHLLERLVRTEGSVAKVGLSGDSSPDTVNVELQPSIAQTCLGLNGPSEVDVICVRRSDQLENYQPKKPNSFNPSQHMSLPTIELATQESARYSARSMVSNLCDRSCASEIVQIIKCTLIVHSECTANSVGSLARKQALEATRVANQCTFNNSPKRGKLHFSETVRFTSPATSGDSSGTVLILDC